MFVRSTGEQYASLGIGKQIDRSGSLCTVEYFDSPTSEPVVHEIESNLIDRVTLAEQTRVYHFDEAAGAPFLANRINESPRFSDGRSAFVRSQTRQRAASIGMSALLASAVELEAHQIEVVRRILQDPVQRYLLADEVGLGKTIEAGVLIRQCILDTQQKCSILVIVPAALVRQWRSELASKSFLGHCLDHSLHVIALDDGDRIRALLPNAMMLVIDEAHHLTERKAGGSNRKTELSDLTKSHRWRRRRERRGSPRFSPDSASPSKCIAVGQRLDHCLALSRMAH